MLILVSSLYFFTASVICKPQMPVLRQSQPNGKQSDSSGDRDGQFVPRNVIRSYRYRWPNGKVPFYIDLSHADLTDAQKGSVNTSINEAMATISAVVAERGINDDTCQIKFLWVDINNPPKDYVVIKVLPDSYCMSDAIGMKGGKQTVTLGLGCADKHYVLHELLHVLGMTHQHSAHNRDEYVWINRLNMQDGMQKNFEKTNVNVYTSFSVGYDYDSIMHYEADDYAKLGKDGKPIGPVITPKDPQRTLKFNTELSIGDKTKLNFMYCNVHTDHGWEYGKEEKR